MVVVAYNQKHVHAVREFCSLESIALVKNGTLMWLTVFRTSVHNTQRTHISQIGGVEEWRIVPGAVAILSALPAANRTEEHAIHWLHWRFTGRDKQYLKERN